MIRPFFIVWKTNGMLARWMRLLEWNAHKTNATSTSGTEKKAAALASHSHFVLAPAPNRSAPPDRQASLCTITGLHNMSFIFLLFYYLYVLAKLGPIGEYGLFFVGTVVSDPIAYCTLQRNTLLKWIADSLVLYTTGVHARSCQENTVSYHMSAYVQCAVVPRIRKCAASGVTCSLNSCIALIKANNGFNQLP